MSAWSSSTGKAQLSYADRLRQASKSQAPAKQDPSSSRNPSDQGNKSRLSASSTLNFSASQATRRSSSASSTGGIAASGSATKTSSHSTEATESSNGGEASAKSAAPPVNIWEARRKQIAEREAEKERERQASLAQQKKAAAATGLATGAGSTSSGKQSKQNAAGSSAGTRKGSERNSKATSNQSASERKTNKQSTQPSNRGSNSVSISASSSTTTAATSDKPNAQSAGSKSSHAAPSTPKSGKADSRVSEESRSASKAVQPSSTSQTAQSAAPSKSVSVDKIQKPKIDGKAKGADATKSLSKQSDSSTSAPLPAQTAAAQLPPSAPLSVQTAPAPIPLHDDVPASPATVASAIEEVLKNGGANGAQTEDDDAWLARIHLLNGGQNMPNFGGFGPNGMSSLSDEAETQAAKKAERAVAAAWGAGKSGWNKSQQQSQPVVSTNVTIAAPGDSGVKGIESAGTRDDAVQKGTESAPVPAAAATSTSSHQSEKAEAGAVAASKGHNENHNAKIEKADAETGPSKKTGNKDARHAVEQSNTASKGAAAKTRAGELSVPQFEDVNNWPSPLDARKKPADKPKASVNSVESDKTDGAKASQPETQKSFFETLDELQLRLAPGANPQQPSNAAGARKGKQQWVPILPEITRAPTSTVGAKSTRPPTDARSGGKVANKQPRKDGSKSVGQTQSQQQGGAKKDGGNRTQTKDKAQAKESASDAVAGGAKSTEARDKNDGRNQTALQKDKEGAVSKSKVPLTSRSTPADARSSQAAAAGQTGVAEPSTTASAPELTTASNDAFTDPAAYVQPSTARQARPPRTHLRTNGDLPPTFQPSSHQLNGRQTTKSGASTPGSTTNRSSPRGSVSSTPVPAFAPAQPMLYGPSGVATPMLSNNPPHATAGVAAPPQWLPYNPYTTRPATTGMGGYIFVDATNPLPTGVLGQLLGQIEFYFSQHNLQGDFFLRQKMDSQGWVDIATLAGFKRVQGITKDIGMVKDALLYSVVLDVDETTMRVRKRFGWEMYTLTPPGNGSGNGGEGGPVKTEQEATEDHHGAAETRPQQGQGVKEEEEDEPALGVVAASGFGGTLDS